MSGVRASLAGVLAFAGLYTLPLWVELPALYYLPLERRWWFGAAPAGLAMDWYGRALAAALAGLLVGRLAGWLTRGRPEPSEAQGRAAALLILAAVGAAAACYAAALWSRALGPT